jgi:nicotinamidase-related amidase
MRLAKEAPMGREYVLDLTCRTQVLSRDSRGRAEWLAVDSHVSWKAHQTALVICDMWDAHWSRGAQERAGDLALRIGQLVQAARCSGLQIVHAPSETMTAYSETQARQRIARSPSVELPISREHVDPHLPIDDSDGGSDTGETMPHRAWRRQHPAIAIDDDRDVISDDGREIYRFFRQNGLEHVIMVGVHTNMCVLNRTFGIKQMVRWGVDAVLVRELTDTMYNPGLPPYVSHAEGTRLVVGYIEKFWCPTIGLAELLRSLRS